MPRAALRPRVAVPCRCQVPSAGLCHPAVLVAGALSPGMATGWGHLCPTAPELLRMLLIPASQPMGGRCGIPVSCTCPCHSHRASRRRRALLGRSHHPTAQGQGLLTASPPPCPRVPSPSTHARWDSTGTRWLPPPPGTLRGGSPRGTATNTMSHFGSLNPNQCEGKHAYYNYPCTKKINNSRTTF